MKIPSHESLNKGSKKGTWESVVYLEYLEIKFSDGSSPLRLASTSSAVAWRVGYITRLLLLLLRVILMSCSANAVTNPSSIFNQSANKEINLFWCSLYAKIVRKDSPNAKKFCVLISKNFLNPSGTKINQVSNIIHSSFLPCWFIIRRIILYNSKISEET